MRDLNDRDTYKSPQWERLKTCFHRFLKDRRCLMEGKVDVLDELLKGPDDLHYHY